MMLQKENKLVFSQKIGIPRRLERFSELNIISLSMTDIVEEITQSQHLASSYCLLRIVRIEANPSYHTGELQIATALS